jgi:hypothetical protein
MLLLSCLPPLPLLFDRRPSRPSVAVAFVVDEGINLARDDIGRRPPAALFRDDDDDVEPPPLDEEVAMTTEQSPILRAIVALTMRLSARCLFIVLFVYYFLR